MTYRDDNGTRSSLIEQQSSRYRVLLTDRNARSFKLSHCRKVGNQLVSGECKIDSTSQLQRQRARLGVVRSRAFGATSVKL